MIYDVFNGDADGICALHQLRMAAPRDSKLISGVKRDIKLLSQLTGVSDSEITVLDISMNSNMDFLKTLLAANCRVDYFDHHFSGVIPESENLKARINLDPNICTSLIVDQELKGQFRLWAIVAAFGDNLHDAARELAEDDLSEQQIAVLRELGELINYNGYGKTKEDLRYAPEDMYMQIKPYENPLDFIENSLVTEELRQGFADDFANARKYEPIFQNEKGRIYKFTGEPWARRIAGVFSNEKAREETELATALIVDNGDKTSMISVRAPLSRKEGADRLCLSFPTGGGRSAAAGINNLPDELEDEFVKAFSENF
jgi:hypothetical protein